MSYEMIEDANFNPDDIDDFLGWLGDFWKTYCPSEPFSVVYDYLEDWAWGYKNKSYVEAGEQLKKVREELEETGF